MKAHAVLWLAAAAACQGTPSRPAVIDGTDRPPVGGTGGGEREAGTDAAGGQLCPGNEPDVTVTDPALSAIPGAAFEIRGTLRFSRNVPMGTGLTFLATTNPGWGMAAPSAPPPVSMPRTSDSVTFSYRFVPPGDYPFLALADTNGDGKFTEADLGGYAGGTAKAPIQKPTGNAVIAIRPTSPLAACNVDFGIGPIVCLKPYGDTCAADGDCRGNYCICSGVVEPANTGSCNPGTKLCEIKASCACAFNDGGVGAPDQGNCVGGFP